MSADQPQPPIACSLAPAELTDRRAVWGQLSRRALREQRLIPGGMQLVFKVSRISCTSSRASRPNAAPSPIGGFAAVTRRRCST